jgi:hypothetical protein
MFLIQKVAEDLGIHISTLNTVTSNGDAILGL